MPYIQSKEFLVGLISAMTGCYIKKGGFLKPFMLDQPVRFPGEMRPLCLPSLPTACAVTACCIGGDVTNLFRDPR